MKRTLVWMLIAACPLVAQKANHEPGETLKHFYSVEGTKDRCSSSLLSHPVPGDCEVLLDGGRGPDYIFRSGVLYSIENWINTGTFDEIVDGISRRYGKPTGREHISQIHANQIATEIAWWQRPGFTVQVLWLKGVHDGNSFEHALLISRTDKKQDRPNLKF